MSIVPLRHARLRYQGIDYGPDYRVVSDKRLYFLKRYKSGKKVWRRIKLHPHGGGYELWYPKNPITKKYHPGIIVSRAVAESFAGEGLDVKGLVAAHGPGTERNDGYLGSCSFKTPKGNREDRKRDKTDSTGHNTAPGRLTDHQVRELLLGWHGNPNKSAWARRFGCSTPNIRYHLRTKLQSAY